MKILHWMKKEASGLVHTALELAKYEERAGHSISLREPGKNETFYGFTDDNFDIHCIHSQINPIYWKDGKPKVLFLHGHPFYGMQIGTSISAILDLVPLVDVFVAFLESEARIWKSFKRTELIQKGVDLEKYKPEELKKKFKGEPAIVFMESWRNFKHPLVLLIAMEQVFLRHPKARLYLFGCPEKDQKLWLRLLTQNKYNLFCPGVFKRQKHNQTIIHMADIVVSPSFFSCGRVSLEALACDKPVIVGESNPHGTYKCDISNPADMARAILQCIDEKPKGMRQYAELHCDAKVTADQAIKIYKKLA